MEPIWIAVAAGGAVLLVVLLLVLGRRKERVIDMSAPVAADDDEPASTATAAATAAASDATSPGELLELRGRDEGICGLGDWLMEDASRALGADLSSDQMVITRLADAAEKASADLKTAGQALVELPYLAADASGPKHYRREMTRAEAELGMIQHGTLLVDELLDWRGRDERTVALGGWLDTEVSDELLDTASVQRLADAAEQAIVMLDQSGRATVDLPSLTTREGKAVHFSRTFDRASLPPMVLNPEDS